MKDKEELGDDLCNYCPLEEEQRGRCEGMWCDEAFQTYIDEVGRYE